MPVVLRLHVSWGRVRESGGTPELTRSGERDGQSRSSIDDSHWGHPGKALCPDELESEDLLALAAQCRRVTADPAYGFLIHETGTRDRT